MQAGFSRLEFQWTDKMTNEKQRIHVVLKAVVVNWLGVVNDMKAT